MSSAPRYLFVTGKLAEPSLRRVLEELAPRAGFAAEVAVLPITVAALLTTEWVARHLTIPERTERIVLPGYCRGGLEALPAPAGASVERGPKDLRDLPEFFGAGRARSDEYGRFDIEILAEINHAPSLALDETRRLAQHYAASGADVIDLGCDPGGRWDGVGDAVKMLRDDGRRVSIDSFNDDEVLAALTAGAELVLSVNGCRIDQARRWHESFPDVEAVAIPDVPADLDSLDRTVEALAHAGVRFRIDPIIEPIGFGFAASLGRYLEARRRYPSAEIMMGVGNLTELTDVDSAGINVMLAGFCQELGVRSVLTTEVINWCRDSVKELDLARRLVYHAVRQKVLPKHLERDLIMLRDPKQYEFGEAGLRDLARDITDRNYRLFAERGEIHVINGAMYLHGTDPFILFEQMRQQDAKLDAAHGFYLGYEMAKAVTALTLGKNYVQDQALNWGFLTISEVSHRG
jgi:dihydropteroate synthase-like protein